MGANRLLELKCGICSLVFKTCTFGKVKKAASLLTATQLLNVWILMLWIQLFKIFGTFSVCLCSISSVNEVSRLYDTSPHVPCFIDLPTTVW